MDFPDDLDGLNKLFEGRHWQSRRLVEGRGQYISNPFSLADAVKLQRRLELDGELKPEAPCVVFLFGEWDGVFAFGTRIGGRPARDCSRPWPINAEGKPLLFLAQLDLNGVDNLPSGVPQDSLLSVYTEIVTGYQDMNLQFEWQSRETATLVGADQIPEGLEALPAFQGKPFVAMDYVAVDPNRFNPDNDDKYIAAFWGTKIGGVNPVLQKILSSRNWGKPIERRVTSLGNFLGTIGCVQADSDAPWPFVDREEPLTWKEFRLNREKYQFMLADMGMIVLHVRENGSIAWDPCLG
jgi:hypothetical protein